MDREGVQARHQEELGQALQDTRIRREGPVRLKMRLIAVMIPLLLMTTSWAQRNGTARREETQADRK
jgi:hypothetical protein